MTWRSGRAPGSFPDLGDGDDSFLRCRVGGDEEHVHAVPAGDGEEHLCVEAGVFVRGPDAAHRRAGRRRLQNTELEYT